VTDRLGRAVDVLVELERRQGRVAAVDGDERVRHRAESLRAPPLALLVGRDRGRASHEGRVPGAGLRLVRLVACAEHDHGLPPRGPHDLARVRRDPRAFGERPEVERLEMGERPVLALDVHDGLVRLRDLAVAQRADPELTPARLPE
jgi:hypothetical protein